MPEAVEIPYAAFQAIEHRLVLGTMGDGRDRERRPFWIRRYTSRETGKIYDLVFVAGVDKEPRCIEITPDKG